MPSNLILLINGFSSTLIFKIFSLRDISIFLKKLESYKFFSILLIEFSSKLLKEFIFDNIVIVSLEIRSFPINSILFIFSALISEKHIINANNETRIFFNFVNFIVIYTLLNLFLNEHIYQD